MSLNIKLLVGKKLYNKWLLKIKSTRLEIVIKALFLQY